MDPITHGLLGAHIARFVRKPQHRGTYAIFGALGAMAPDLDIFYPLLNADPMVMLRLHRGMTHALLCTPLVALLITLIALCIPKLAPLWKDIAKASLVGAVTHGLLDACTSYGTQILWPFSSLRVSFDSMPQIDLVFTLLLVVGLCLAFSHKASLLWSMVAFVYIGFGFFAHHKAKTLALEAMPVAAQIDQLRVMPYMFTLLHFRTAAMSRSRKEIYLGEVHLRLLGKGKATPNLVRKTLFTADELPTFITRSPKLTADFSTLLWFSHGFLTKIAQSNEKELILQDALFLFPKLPQETMFSFRFLKDQPIVEKPSIPLSQVIGHLHKNDF